MSKAPEIIFHVGLGKTGSSYLQQHFFPKLKGIHYIPTSRYRFSPKIITKRHHQKYLVSREFDRQFDREVEWFSAMYPDARPVMVLRRHDSWIASQYRRQVKTAGNTVSTSLLMLNKTPEYGTKKNLTFQKN